MRGGTNGVGPRLQFWVDVLLVYLLVTILTLKEKTLTAIARAVMQMAAMSEIFIYVGIYGVRVITNGSKALDRMAFHMARVVCMEPMVEVSHGYGLFQQLGKADRHGPIMVMAMAMVMVTAMVTVTVMATAATTKMTMTGEEIFT
jgi:hypothetical protein